MSARGRLSLKERLSAHITELVLSALGTVTPVYLFLAEDRLVAIFSRFPLEWIIRAFAALLALVLWLFAWLVFRKQKLTFDEAKGVYLDRKSGFHVCPKCLSEEKTSLLRNEDYAYRCPVCDKYYPDPARPSPRRERRKSTWMAS